ncbi:MAG: hypothetical protein COZ50_02925 [Zetaproteobacteria bacterium CG_4_10_14_3_um_filter_54_28]|nr:MAG: hypothetical protein COZ50_02925 [Zetaproteobacteria bacterium CG_4_10_14_3_um_filter_54_28]
MSGHNLNEINEILESNDELRQQLFIIRIERLFEIKGSSFKPYDIHLHDRLYHSKAEDLEFWKESLVAWADEQPMNKMAAAWEEFKTCWGLMGNLPEVLDWIVEQTETYPSIAELWERDRCIPVSEEHMIYRRKRALEKKERERERSEWFDAIRQAVSDIEQGHEGWLNNIVSNLRFEEHVKGDIESWLDLQVGNDVSIAFSKGLNAYWSNSEAPETTAYASNQVPWWSNVIIMAVERWLVECGDWNGLAAELRQRAIRAALWNCDVPAWFFDAARVDQVWAKAFLYDVLSVEDDAGSELHRVLYLFSGHGGESFVRDVVISFLLSKEKLCIQTAKQALRLLCENAEDRPLDDSTLDQLWAVAQRHRQSAESETFLLFASAVFRFRQVDVWQVVDSSLLAGEERGGQFQRWLNAIAEIHLRFRFEGKWPACMGEESIAAMLPDMFAAFPPDGDPEMDGYNDGKMYREDMGRLRNHGITVLAEGGSGFAGKQLMALLTASFVPDFMHSLILNCIDIWCVFR